MSVPAPIPALQPIAQPQPCFLIERHDIAQAGYDAAFVDFGVRGTDMSTEIGLEVFDGQDFWDEFKGGGSGHAGTVFGEDIEGWLPLGFVG